MIEEVLTLISFMPCSCLLATKLFGIRYQHVINNLKTKVVLFFEKNKMSSLA